MLYIYSGCVNPLDRECSGRIFMDKYNFLFKSLPFLKELQDKAAVHAGYGWRTGWEQILTILMPYEFMPKEKHL